MTRREMLLLTGLVVIGGTLRAWTIGSWPLWIDEALSWKFAHVPWGELVAWQRRPDNPPLSFALVRLSIALFGTDAEWALRLPSLVAGILAIPAGYLLGRTAGQRGTGLALAALIAFDPQFMLQARYARMYSLYILLAALILTGFAALVRAASPRRTGWAALGLGLAAVFWTHALSLFLWFGVLAGGVTEAVRRRADPKRAARVVIGVGLALATAAVLSVPGLIAFWRMLVRFAYSSAGAGTPATLQVVLRDKFGPIGAEPIGLAVAAAFAVGVVVIGRGQPALAVTLATTALASLGTGLVAAARQGFGGERYTILFWLVAWTGVAAAASAPRRGGGRALALGAFGALVLLLAARSAFLDRPAHHLAGGLARTIAASEPAPVRYDPAFLIEVGNYYGLTSAPDRRSPRTWVLIYSNSLDPAARDTLTEMARAYDARWNPSEVDRRLRADRAVAIEFGRDSVRLLSP